MKINFVFRSLFLAQLLLLAAPGAHAVLDPPHDAGKNIGCLSCHDMTSTEPNLLPPLGHIPLPGDIDDTTSNGVCWSCHNDTVAPYRVTHSSLQTDASYGQWTVECSVCHNQHLQEQKYNGSSYGKFIRRSINLANIRGADGNTLPGKSGSKTVRFLRPTGPNSFADGDATVDGVCEVCHTDTNAWHNDGTLAGTGAHSGLKGSNCMTCHPHSEGFRAIYECLDCHQSAINDRAAVGEKFSGNSHHIQGIAITSDKCYQCHWEADAAGKLTSHHEAIPGAAVDLVIYGAGIRPETYTNGVTAVAYVADGSRAQIQGINSHCLGCHSDQNNAAQPFADGKTPKHYAWDGSSVAARYTQSGTTAWGKYSGPNITPKNSRTKAFSAHGNAVANQGGWDLNETWPNTRNGSVNVACYDCHNSHGSSTEGTTASYASATTNGGILKDTDAGKGGYAMAYKPAAGGTAENKNLHGPGAALCFDCHLTANGAADKPWGYQSTFGAGQDILGYFDSPYLAPGAAGAQLRYPYKGIMQNAGGHFGASAALSSTPLHQINGLCTPCHDPHGVSPTLGPDQQYSVPLLKGTWVTSPYKEDAAPANNAVGTVRDNSYPLGHDGTPREGVPYHIDQNTFGVNIRSTVTGVSQPDGQFAGLCLRCHPKDSLTDGVNGGAWKSVDRIHESVKGWGANIRHNYTCSKCHAPHNGSALPRLMITNCLNGSHKGRTGFAPSPVLSGSGNCDDGNCYGEAFTLGFGWWEELYAFGNGGGQFPGSWGGEYPGSYSVSCHENKTADQSWNTVTAWSSIRPVISSGPFAAIDGQMALLHMDEGSWTGAPGEIIDSSGLNHHGTAYNGADTASGGISGNAGAFNGSDNYLRINYSPPVDNFTMMAWIKPTATHQTDPESTSGTGGTFGQRYLFGADFRGSESGAGVSAGSNGISVYEHGSGYMPALAVYTGSISTSEWTHVAIVYANKRPSIYINGVLVRTGLQSLKAHVYAPTRIGGGDYGYFPGSVDEAALYNKALSALEIQLHFQRQSSTVCNADGVEITWTTDHDSSSLVDYGLTADYGQTEGNGSLVKHHAVGLTGLLSPATYHYRVRSANADGEAVSEDRTFTLDPAVCPPTLPILASPTATSITVSSATLGATILADGDSPLIERGTVWSTAPSPTGNALAEGGSGSGPFTQARMGLPAGSRIYYRGYATNSEGTSYSPQGSFYTEPLLQASGVAFPATSQTGMTVNWTRGDGDGVIVLMKQGAPVDAYPVDGIHSAYTASATFGGGSQLGSGNYIIHLGPDTGVAVSGLIPETTYHVAVIEYTGTGTTAGANQGINYKQTAPATGSQSTTAFAGGSYSYTFSYTGDIQSLFIPAGATNLQFSVKGAGGGGGRRDNVNLQTPGQNGHLVEMPYASANITLSIYVGGGGREGSATDSGALGGWGYHAGGNGGNGDYEDFDCWAYGGAGGGGSSAITLGATPLIEAAGGAGGRSDDWDDWCYAYGGSGGVGGGSDFPGTTSPTGGGTGGSAGYSPTAGGAGQIIISFDL
ncbi:MAG: LamG-like jellyroll fold domain-containing protein [Desulfobulbaceae bacterium]